MNSDSSKPDIDWIDVSREGFELEQRHGRNAHVVAAQLADKADAAGEVEAARFWRAVWSSMRPRG